MSTSFGNNIRIEIFGKSHSEFIGMRIEGFPAGEVVDMKELEAFLSRRAPGKEGVSQRKESDKPVFKSGITDGLTDGKIIEAVIYNEDVRSEDYKKIKDTPRPGHADYPAYVRSDGTEDLRGGGKFSGRMTAPYCIAGGIAKQILSKRGIEIKAVLETDFKADKDDSTGGIVYCEATGLPVGLGDSLFDGIDGYISYMIFAIPAVKGIEFGKGFAMASMKGSEANDEYYFDNGKVAIKTNNAGGVLGGMTTGAPLTFRVAFKPTPSIKKVQRTVNLATMEETEISVDGRHDPCIAKRAIPVVESALALAILDKMPSADVTNLRNKIDIIDRKIGELLKERFKATDEIGEYKKKNGLEIKDTKREFEVIDNVASKAGEGLEKEIARIYSDIFELSRKRQQTK